MAVSIDNVYQQVLAIANKEQRGYITPQEFNLLARKAQLDIFETYFHEIGIAEVQRSNDTEYGDKIEALKEKISPFEKFEVAMSAVSSNELTLPTSTAVHKLGTVFYNAGSFNVVVDPVEKKDLTYIERGGKTGPSDRRPVYVRKTDSVIKLFPASPTVSYSTSNVTCNYVAKPADPNWTYVVVNNRALHNSSASDKQDFEFFSTPFSLKMFFFVFKNSLKFDYIHIITPNPWPTFFISFIKTNNIIISWGSDIINQKILKFFFKKFQNSLLKKAKKIICLSKNYLNHSEDLKKFKSKIIIIPPLISINSKKKNI